MVQGFRGLQGLQGSRGFRAQSWRGSWGAVRHPKTSKASPHSPPGSRPRVIRSPAVPPARASNLWAFGP